MNYPSPDTNPNRVHAAHHVAYYVARRMARRMVQRIARSLCLLILLTCLLITASSCGRDREPEIPEATAEGAGNAGPTPTSSAILAATPTFTPENAPSISGNGAGEEIAGQNNGGENVDQERAGTEGQAVDANGENASETENNTTPPVCTQEIALDLVGHPQYATLSEKLGCPLAAASVAPVAINEFGTGPDFDSFMLWYSTNTQIYVLKPDQTWQSFPDTWTEAEAEILCNPLDGDNTSPPLPRRGFGKLWCSDSELQEVMGTIEREERLCQHTVAQEFEKGELLGCFEDATIRYFQIFNDGSWEMKFVQ